MILGHTILKKQNSLEHSIRFNFAEKDFEVLVVETADETYVAECLWIHGRGMIEVDIPDFFGKGFSSDIFSMIYNEVEKAAKQDAEEDEDEDDGDELID
jgi:hypothetical protein